MTVKPSDVYVGTVDFFSSVVPGSIAAFLLFTSNWIRPPPHWPVLTWGSAEGWAVFLVAAYLLGHLITAIGSFALDPVYDRFYARWRRAHFTYTRSQFPPNWPVCEVICRRIAHVVRKSNPDDELLVTAKAIKRLQLKEIAKAANLSPDAITSTFWWAGTVIRAKNPAGAAEVVALMAQSKLFRGVTLLVPLAACWVGSDRLLIIVAWVAVFLLCLWRFFDLRWGAVERTYEYFIVTALLPDESQSKARHNMAST